MIDPGWRVRPAFPDTLSVVLFWKNWEISKSEKSLLATNIPQGFGELPSGLYAAGMPHPSLQGSIYGVSRRRNAIPNHRCAISAPQSISSPHSPRRGAILETCGNKCG